MGITGYPRRLSAPPTTVGSDRRPHGDGRLDPVRWRRPGRGMLVRLTAVAALLATAAAVSWSPPQTCAPVAGAPAFAPPSSRGPASQPSMNGMAGATPPAGVESGGGTHRAPDVGIARNGVSSAAVPPGSVGVPVRLAEPSALALVHPGNHVDLLRLDSETGGTTTVATAALVLDVTGLDDPTTGALLLALAPAQARQAVVTRRQGYAVVIRPG